MSPNACEAGHPIDWKANCSKCGAFRGERCRIAALRDQRKLDAFDDLYAALEGLVDAMKMVLTQRPLSDLDERMVRAENSLKKARGESHE